MLKAVEADLKGDPAAMAQRLLEFRRLLVDAPTRSLSPEDLQELSNDYTVVMQNAAASLRPLGPEALDALDTPRALALLRLEVRLRKRLLNGGLSDAVLRELAGTGWAAVVRLPASRALALGGDASFLKDVLAPGPAAGGSEWLEAMALWVETGGEVSERHLELLAEAVEALRQRETPVFERVVESMSADVQVSFLSLLSGAEGALPLCAAPVLGRFAARHPDAVAGIWRRLDGQGRGLLLAGALEAHEAGTDFAGAVSSLEGLPDEYADFFRGLSGDFKGVQGLLMALEEGGARAASAARLLYHLDNAAGVPLLVELLETGLSVEGSAAATALVAGGMVPMDLVGAVTGREMERVWTWWRIYRNGYEVKRDE